MFVFLLPCATQDLLNSKRSVSGELHIPKPARAEEPHCRVSVNTGSHDVLSAGAIFVSLQRDQNQHTEQTVGGNLGQHRGTTSDGGVRVRARRHSMAATARVAFHRRGLAFQGDLQQWVCQESASEEKPLNNSSWVTCCSRAWRMFSQSKDQGHLLTKHMVYQKRHSLPNSKYANRRNCYRQECLYSNPFFSTDYTWSSTLLLCG